jgi:hypothetical protein
MGPLHRSRQDSGTATETKLCDYMQGLADETSFDGCVNDPRLAGAEKLHRADLIQHAQ